MSTQAESPISNLFLYNGLSIVLYTAGSRTININNRSHSLTSPIIMILAPNTLGYIEWESDDSLSRTISITLESIMEMPNPIDTDILLNARRHPFVLVPQDRLADLIAIFDRIDRCRIANHIYGKELRAALIYALVLDIADLQHGSARLPSSQTKVRQERLSDTFFLLLAKHYRSNRNIAFYAEIMILSPKYLSSEIKRITGKSIHQWINDTLMIEIKNLLRTTPYTLLQISEQLNFPSPSTFVQYFKKQEGITPAKYRVLE